MNASPIYDPAQAITGMATGAAVVGGRLLKVAAAKTDGNPVPVAHCGAAEAPIGVSGSNVAQDVVTQVYPPGMVLTVEAGGTVTAGLGVEVMADGKVQVMQTSPGKKVGVAFTSGSNGDAVLVQLQF